MSVKLYNFSVDDFTINNTRSRHKDTDYISASVAVAGRPTRSAHQKLGDLNNGTFPTAMQFDGVPVASNETAIFTYLIVNSGHSDPDAAEKALEQAAKTLAEKGAQAAASAAGGAIGAELGAAIGTEVVPVLGTALGAVAGWAVTTLGSLAFADCDGPVAAAVHTYTGIQLRDGTSAGLKLTDNDHHPGVDSAHGCGGNSIYDVRWTIKEHVAQIGKPITDKWNSLGGAKGFLGSPVMDEAVCPDKVGHFVYFENGAIYWTPQTNAFSVHGAILEKWGSLGWERSKLGYPVSDEHEEAGKRVSDFQHGRILWTLDGGATVA